MLTKLILKNVSRVEEAEIDLPQLLRIEGSNNAGKTSAIYRSLEVMMLGESFPESMVRRGQKSAYMALEFSDKRKIEYRREGKKQSVTLIYPDGNIRKFETIKGSEEEIRKFTGGIVVKPDKKSDKETPQFVPISASQVYMIQGMSDETILKRLTNLAGGSGIAVAKQRIESSLREKKGELKALEEIVCEARTEAENALTCLEPLNDLNSRYEACRGQEKAVLKRQEELDGLWMDHEARGYMGDALDGIAEGTLNGLMFRINAVKSDRDLLSESEYALRMLHSQNVEMGILENELDKIELLVYDLEQQIEEEFKKVPVCEVCGQEMKL